MCSYGSESPDIDIFMDDLDNDFELDFELEPPSTYHSSSDAGVEELLATDYVQNEDDHELEDDILNIDDVEMEEDAQSDDGSDTSEIATQSVCDTSVLGNDWR